MSEALGQVLSLAVAVGLSPIPIIGIVLMLATPRARSNGLAFVVGWVAGLTVVGAILLFVLGSADAGNQGQPADWVNLLKLVLGALLLLVAARQWRSRPQGEEKPKLPGWMATVDHFTATRAASFGVVLSVVNPKNLVLVVAAASAIAQTGASAGEQAVALAVFVLIGTIGTGVPVLLYFAVGERSRQFLDGLKGWMAQNNGAIMAVICLVIGAKLIGDGISGF